MTKQPTPAHPYTAGQRSSRAVRRAHAAGLLAPGIDPPSQQPEGTAAVPTVGQRDARLRARTRTARPADPAGAEARLVTYVPDSPLVRPHAPLLRALAGAAGPVDGADAAELVGALAGHAAWLCSAGRDVDATALLDPDLVQQWVLHGLRDLSAGTSANYRSRIARVAAAVNGRVREPVALHASSPSEIYSPTDEDDLLSWGTGQRNPAMRADVLVLLCTGLGAGLSTTETLDVTGTDVRARHDRTVTIDVRAGRPRTVPVRARYAPLLLELTDQAGSNPLFRPGAPGRGGKNAVSNLVARARTGTGTHLPVLSPQRMRATWLVRHLDAGTRVDALLRAAGLDSLAVLDRYLTALAPLTPEQVLDELVRGRA